MAPKRPYGAIILMTVVAFVITVFVRPVDVTGVSRRSGLRYSGNLRLFPEERVQPEVQPENDGFPFGVDEFAGVGIGGGAYDFDVGAKSAPPDPVGGSLAAKQIKPTEPTA